MITGNTSKPGDVVMDVLTMVAIAICLYIIWRYLH